MNKFLLLINEKARSGAGSHEQIESALMERGLQVFQIPQEEKDSDFNVLIRKYHQQVDAVIVGGGDGTINALLPSLVETKLPLIVFPLGTANLLARSFEIKADVQEIMNIIEKGRTVTIDLGEVNGIYFINVCGLGISTEVNRSISPTLKKLTGPFSFWLTGLKLSPRLRPFKMKLTVDGKEPLVTRTWQLTICNGRKYAAWMTIEPQAAYDDETLHGLSTEIQKWWQGFKLFPCYIKGDYKNTSDLTLVSGKEIKVETKRTLQIDVDGDVQTTTPATFKVIPKVLNLVVPASAVYDSSPVGTQLS